MMKPTGLVAAAGVLAALSVTIWWTNKHPKAVTPATPPSPQILSLKEDQITGIRIAKPGVDAITLKKLADNWVVAEPQQVPADQDTAKSMVGSLASLTADRMIDEHPTDLAQFGLVVPPEEIDVTESNGNVDKVLIGSDTPSGSTTYAKLASKPGVYTLASTTKSTFDKGVNDLRDKRLLPFNQDKVTAVSLTSRGPAFEFGKNGQGDWQITKPKPMRADTQQVDDLVRKLKDAKMDLATDDDQKKAAAEFAAATKVATASVTDNSGTETIELRQAKDKTYYAKSSALPGFYKLSGDLGDGVKDKDVDGFRNKKLFDFAFNDPTKIEINGNAYQKTADKWNAGSAQYDAGSIQSVVDKLRDLSAAKFADKPGGSQALTLAVTSGDNHKVEKVTLNKSGDEYDAIRDGDPTVYVLDAAAFGDLQKAISGIRPYTAPKSGKK